MVRGAARLDLSKTQVLSAAQAKFVEKLQQKLGFYRKLRAFQKQGKKKRASIKKFAKKHRFSYSSVWKALPFAKERLARLEQSVNASKSCKNAENQRFCATSLI
jgi:predicted transcriptional regulator